MIQVIPFNQSVFQDYIANVLSEFDRNKLKILTYIKTNETQNLVCKLRFQ